MRTSRIARDTASLVSALSPRRTGRRQLRSSSAILHNNVTAQRETQDETPSKHESSESDLFAPPSDVDSDASGVYTPGSRKRKRGVASPNGPVVTHVQNETVIARSSPRKPDAKSNGTPKKAKRQPAKRVTVDGAVKVEPPPKWEEVYNLTREMRARWPAPVDTMGCESLAEEERSPRDQRFQTLVALMLSSQTKDTVTSVAIKNLQENLSGGLTLESILAVEPSTLNDLISKVGFHNNKTKFIKAAAEILRDQFESDIPPTIEGLVSLPGVGPKMAYLCMSAAWGKDEGIGVDVHVHRITNLWGWHKTKTPEETRAALESWLPKDKWHDINNLLVGFGQTWCPPVGRQCDVCKLAERGLCPSAVVGKKIKEKVKTKDSVVRADSEDADVKREVDVELEVRNIRAEDLPDAQQPSAGELPIQDIEDFGPRRRKR